MTDKPLYGGQAVIEGVMMRGRHFVACAVREPGGQIIVTSEPLASAVYSSRWSRTPFLRAITLLWDTLVLGTKMLIYSANIAVAGAAVPATADAPNSGLPGGKPVAAHEPTALGTGAALSTVGVALAFGVGLFFVLPLVLVSFADPLLNTWLVNNDLASFASNVIEGLIRLALFLGYIGGISLMPDVRRVFQYHGAEHKTIAADEAGAPLVPESIQRYGKEHPRCGTGFLLTVAVVSIIVFAALGRPPIMIRILSRVLFIPVVAALSYELIKYSSAHRGNPILNWLVVKPSLALQSLTTREPDPPMIEVAVAALQRVQAEERTLHS